MLEAPYLRCAASILLKVKSACSLTFELENANRASLHTNFSPGTRKCFDDEFALYC